MAWGRGRKDFLKIKAYKRDLLKQEIGFGAASEANMYIKYTYTNRCLNKSSLINNFILKNENSLGNLIYYNNV